MMLAAPPPGHAHPGWHWRVLLVDPGGHHWVAPQLMHVALVVALVAAEYVPDRHGAVSRLPPPQNHPAGQMTVSMVDPGGQ